jgi:HK97 family phage major capsid protein
MATPTLESVQRIENRAEQLRAQIESYLLECRAGTGDELDAVQSAKFRAMNGDLHDLESRAAFERSELERCGSLPGNLAARVAGLSRPVRGGTTAGQLSPLAPPVEELRRLHDTVQRGQNATFERRFTSAVDLLPPELFPYPIAQIHEDRLLNFLPGFQIELPSVEYVRHVSTTGSAGAVAEGQPKPRVELVVDKLIAAAVKLSALLSLSREIYMDWDAFSQYALAELQRIVIDRENLSLLTGDGTNNDQVGFYNTPGIIVHDCTTDTGPDDTIWDSFERSIAQLRVASALAEPDLLVLHPLDWSAARRVKDSLGRYLVSPDPSDDQVNEAWGCKVLVTTQNPVGQGLFIDTRKFGRVAIREALGMFLGYNADDFSRNLLSWVAEERLVLTVERPAAVLKLVNIPAPTAAAAPAKSTARK